MGKVQIFFRLFIIILIVSGLVMIKPASAQTMPKPSVPEFTLKYVDDSYNVTAAYGIDPYTGKSVVTREGYYVQNKSIELTIKNQPFDSYYNENGSLVGLFYDVIEKGHFENWTTANTATNYAVSITSYDPYPGLTYRSDSSYTIISYGFVGNNGTNSQGMLDVSIGGQVDFQVKAIIGYSTRINDTFVPGIPADNPSDSNPRHYIFTGVSSDWSGIQTITISDNSTPMNPDTSATPNLSVLPSQNPTVTLSQPAAGSLVLLGLDWIGIVVLALFGVVVVLLVFVVVYLRRRSVG
jgi:hypothetical protein